MLSHPRLLKCCQTRIYPKFLKPEMRKHRQESNFPKIPRSPGIYGECRGYSCSDFGNFGEFDPCRCFRVSGFRNFGEIRACRCFCIRGCPPPMIHCLQKTGLGRAWGGGGGGGREHAYIYIYIYTYTYTYTYIYIYT